ncbi:hypothetical protein [Mangrovicella endophytica]|uniref:hypothetical protein n=1 Tax=Mangrovicella endophytica TaxID=2066697 RepID=UPI000C9E56CA|nr:hypothetical protein [Mangrovicella endophytica]
MPFSLRAFTKPLLTAAIALASTMPGAHADLFTRAEAEFVINQAAPRWLLDADNHHLTVERLRLPRHEGEMGVACGPILPIGSPRINDGKQSYWSTLQLQDGKLIAGVIGGFYMPVGELLADSLCQ